MRSLMSFTQCFLIHSYTMLYYWLFYFWMMFMIYILHHVTSHYIILHHIRSYYIILHHITSCYIILHHSTSYYIILHHITSYYMILHHIASYYIFPYITKVSCIFFVLTISVVPMSGRHGRPDDQTADPAWSRHLAIGSQENFGVSINGITIH